MKILIIHIKDKSTDFLKESYNNLKCKVIKYHINKTNLIKHILNNDVIIMLGHGNYEGLFGKKNYIIDSSFKDFLKNKKCYYILRYQQLKNLNIFIQSLIYNKNKLFFV